MLDKISYGWSPEEMHFQHPHLSLAQIHATLAYYYENKQEIDAEIEHRNKHGEELSRQSSDPGLRRKLLDRQHKVTMGQCVSDVEIIAGVSEIKEWMSRVEHLPLK